MKRYFLFALLIVSVSSCQKVINVNLNDSDPQYIIQGNVTDQPGPYTVLLTRSKNFSADNNFPVTSGATVAITDVTAGVTDTLTETVPGTYKTLSLVGMPGHTYNLYVKSGDRVFTASSTMPPPVTIDSITTQKSVFGADVLYAVPYYTDPVTTGNRYRLTQRINNTVIKGGTVRSDEVTNGQTAKFPLFYDTDDNSGNPKIKTGDSVFVTLQTIDIPVYEFYRTLEDTKDQNSATQSNPLTNIKGGGMGYFCASAVRTTGALIK